MSQGSHTISREQFLTMSVNLLYKAFLQSRRTEAKQIFRDMLAGKAVPLTNVQMEDQSLVRFDVTLDHSLYRGKLNFGSFRAGLALLVARLSDALREQREITVFTSEHDPHVMIFGVTAVTWEEDEDVPSVMVLGADTSSRQAVVALCLQYLDPEQFQTDESIATPA